MNKFRRTATPLLDVPIDIIITIGGIPCIVADDESLIETEIYAWPAPGRQAGLIRGRTHPLTERHKQINKQGSVRKSFYIYYALARSELCVKSHATRAAAKKKSCANLIATPLWHSDTLSPLLTNLQQRTYALRIYEKFTFCICFKLLLKHFAISRTNPAHTCILSTFSVCICASVCVGACLCVR